MSIKNDTTNPGSLHAIRQDFRAACRRQITELEAQLTELKQVDRETEIIRYRERELKELDKRSAAMRAKQPMVYVEDIIIDRLSEAEVNLSLAVGLFKELSEDKQSPYLPYGAKLNEALDIVQDALHLRNPKGKV